MNGIKLAVLFTVILFALLLLPLSSAEEFSATASARVDACSCSIVKSAISIANREIVNGFVLEQSGEAAKWSTLTEKKFVLAPMQSKAVDTYVNVPCGAEGSYDLITTLVTDTRIKKVMKQQIVVKKCQSIKITPKNAELAGCRCSQFNYFFGVENTGSFEDVYSFSVDRLGSYAKTTVPLSLSAGEKSSALLLLNMPCDEAGSYSFNLVAKSRRNDFELKTPLKLNIKSSCALGNFTPAEPFWQRYSAVGLVALPAVLILILLAILVLAFTHAPKKPVEKQKLDKHYAWENEFKEPGAQKKSSFALWLALVFIAAILVINSLFIIKIITPGMVKNETNVTGAEHITAPTNITTNITNIINLTSKTGWKIPITFRSYEGNLFDGFFNTSLVPWIKGEGNFFKGFFSTKLAPWINISTSSFVWKETAEKAAEKKETVEESKETEEKGEANSVISKARGILTKAGVAVKNFVLTYLYYILTGLVILALVLAFLISKERRISKETGSSDNSHKTKKRGRRS